MEHLTLTLLGSLVLPSPSKETASKRGLRTLRLAWTSTLVWEALVATLEGKLNASKKKLAMRELNLCLCNTRRGGWLVTAK